jgi:hypothetical protein
MLVALPVLNVEVLVEKPGSLTNRQDWVWPQVSREQGVNFLSFGPWEAAWCYIGRQRGTRDSE